MIDPVHQPSKLYNENQPLTAALDETSGNALNISAEGRSASFQGDTHLKKQAAGLFEI